MTSLPKLSDPHVESLGEFGARQTDSLCDALTLDAREKQEAQALFRFISRSWADSPLGEQPPFRNDITDDSTPFEFSVGFEAEKPELRLLFESQLSGKSSSLRSSWDAGVQLHRQLQGQSDTNRFERIAPLFAPATDQLGARFSLWHAAVLRPGASSLFKAYLNPEIKGSENAPMLVAEALGRLSMPAAWRFVQERLARDARIPYLSLDLEAERQARVKVYLGASHANAVESMLSGCMNYRPGDARQWLKTLTGGEGDYLKRPILVCFSFTGESALPNGTLHVPVRSYVSGDEEALQRTVPLLPDRSARRLESALKCLALRPLPESRGVLSYVSLRPVEGRVRVTAYLAPCAYSVTSHHYSSGTHLAE